MSRSTKRDVRPFTPSGIAKRVILDERFGTEKVGARRRVELKPPSPEMNGPLLQRRMFGSTEKILRRNRKIWTRLYAKIGRRFGRHLVKEALETSSKR